MARGKIMSQDRSSSVGDAADGQRYVVMSIDSHVGPSVKDQLRPYCEAQYLDDFDRFVAEMESQGLLSWRSSEAKSGEKQSWSLGKSLAERGKAEAEKLGQAEAEKRDNRYIPKVINGGSSANYRSNSAT